VTVCSEPATGNYSEEQKSPGHSSSTIGGSSFQQRTPPGGNSSSLSVGDMEADSNGGSTRNPVTSSMDDRIVGIVAGTLAAFGLLLIGVVVFCIVCRRRRFAAAKKSAAGKVPVNRPNYAAAISGRLSNDVILTSSGRKTSNGGNAYSNSTAYGAAVTSLLQQQQLPGIDDGYDDDDIIKVAPPAPVCENGIGGYDTYNHLGDVVGLQPRRPLPDVPRLPVDLGGSQQADLIFEHRAIIHGYELKLCN
jgi:hypothetical protein